VFIPYIEEPCSLKEFVGREAVLLMDNCAIHTKSETLQVLAEHQVKVITFPRHAAHIFQALDFSLFGVFKKIRNSQLPFQNDETTIGFIKHIFHNLKQSSVEDNVRGAFVHLDLTNQLDVIPYFLVFNEDELRES
jgi:hypothetical protein